MSGVASSSSELVRLCAIVPMNERPRRGPVEPGVASRLVFSSMSLRVIGSPASLARISRAGWRTQSRGFMSFLGRKTAPPKAEPGSGKLLDVDDVFYPLSESPFKDLQQRAANIRTIAPCPVCLTQDKPIAVKHECPDCGWPTHCTESHWEQDKEHAKFCSRLREANEDEHDLRSGRHFHEFEMPSFPDTEQTISLSSWDVFWYTRGFPSFDRERSRRIASKVLTYPMTIGGVLHQNSALNMRNQRLTPEGLRSMTGAPRLDWSILVSLLTVSFSAPLQPTCPSRLSRTVPGAKQHGEDPHLHSRSPRRVVPPLRYLAANGLPLPVSQLPHLLHRPTGIYARQRTHSGRRI